MNELSVRIHDSFSSVTRDRHERDLKERQRTPDLSCLTLVPNRLRVPTRRGLPVERGLLLGALYEPLHHDGGVWPGRRLPPAAAPPALLLPPGLHGRPQSSVHAHHNAQNAHR